MPQVPRKPNLKPDIERKITYPTVNPRPDGTLDEFINDIKRSGRPLYADQFLPLSKNLGVVHKKDKITPSTQVLVNMIGVSAKAKMLLDLIDKTQKQLSEKDELYIPVKGSIDTIKAIARTYPKSSTNHDRIYWNMWVDVVRAKIRQGDVISAQVLEDLTGNVTQDSQIIEDQMRAGEILTNQLAAGRSGTVSTGTPGPGPAPIDRGEVRRQSERSDNAQMLIELLGYGASLVLLYFLNRQLDIYKAPETHALATSSTYTPSPAGAAVMIIQIIIGLVVNYLLQGLLTDDAKYVIDKINIPGVTDKDKEDMIRDAGLIAGGGVALGGPLQGKGLNDPEVLDMMGLKPGILGSIKAYFNRADYELIYEYGLSWLAANANAIHTKGDFSQWVILPELEAMIYRMDNTIDEAANYSDLFEENAATIDIKQNTSKTFSPEVDVNYSNFMRKLQNTTKNILSESEKTLAIAGKRLTSFNNDAAFDEFKNRFEAHAMINSLLDNLHGQNCEDNNSIDRLAAFLTHDPFVATAICCFVKYFGVIDLKLLHAIRAILQIFAKGIVFDLGNFLNTISSNIYNDIFNRARASLLANLNRIMDTIFKEVLSWMDAESIEALADCLPIDAVLKFAANSMLEMRTNMNNLIDGYIKSAEVEVYTLDSKISILEEQKWAKTLFQIVDAIIEASANGNDCALTGDPFKDPATKGLIESLLNDPSRQSDSIFYNSMITENDLEGVDINGPTTTASRDDIRSFFGNRLNGVVVTKTALYTPQINNERLRALLDESTVFNTFTDNAGFITQNGIKVTSIIENLNNNESFKMTIDSAINPSNMTSCFQSIEQTNLLKRVMGNING